MAFALQLTPISPFVVDDTISLNLHQKWTKYKEEFILYVTASGIKHNIQKLALLLHLGGKDLRDIYHPLKEEGDTYDSVVTKLDEHFKDRVNVIYERYVFKSTKQFEGESTMNFITRLRKMGESCKYAERLDEEIRDQFIFNCYDDNLRKKLLRQHDLTLQKLSEISLIEEQADKQAAEMSKKVENQLSTTEDFRNREENESVNKLGWKGSGRRQVPGNSKQSYNRNKQGNVVKTCFRCGEEFTAGHMNNCKAMGKTCYSCNNKNHFSNMCKKKNIKHLTRNHMENNSESGESDGSDQLFALFQSQRGDKMKEEYNEESMHKDNLINKKHVISQVKNDKSENNKSKTVNITVGKTRVKMIIDSGSPINVIDLNTWQKIKKADNKKLVATKKKIYSYGNDEPLSMRGYFTECLETKNKIHVCDIYVVNKNNAGNLIGIQAATELGLLHIKDETTIANITYGGNLIKNVNPDILDIVQKHSALQYGKGKIKDYECILKTNPTIQPVYQRVRRQPYHLRTKIKKEIQKLLAEGIIECVNTPQEWMSNIVITPKSNGDIRICLDAREVNQAIICEKYPTPTIDQLMEKFGGSIIFSKIDLRDAYSQIPLAEESRKLTNFVCDEGTFRHTRLTNGISDAGDYFQQCLHNSVGDIADTACIVDDIIIASKSIKEHKVVLDRLLYVLGEKGFKINPNKCIIGASKISFYGVIFSKEGISPDPDKVSCLKNAKPPTCQQEVRSFLGLCTYLSKFIENYSEKSEPLRKLTEKHRQFQWGEKEQYAFESLREALTSEHTIAYYNPDKECKLWVDASGYAIGAVLLQENSEGVDTPICYISKALNEREKKYCITEKESLALVWAIQKLNVYLYGKHFQAYVDHQPLKFIFGPRNKGSPRIERWQMFLQGYKFTINYKKGSLNIADYLSRMQVSSPSTQENNENTQTEIYINMMVTSSLPKTITLEEIRTNTVDDEELSNLKKAMNTGEWNGVEKYKQFSHEFAEHQGIVMRCDKIVIPKRLQQKILRVVHQDSHLGIVKTKQVLRSKVYWWNMDNDVESMIKQCLPCQAVSLPNKAPPVVTSDPPAGPWVDISMDFYDPIPGGGKLLVIIDNFSRFPLVEIMRTTTEKVLMVRLEQIFGIYGYPESIRSDNGPPFQGKALKMFLKYRGIKHVKITPLWPRRNGIVESFMKNIKKCMQLCIIENRKEWKETLVSHLASYRNTPHSTTKYSPSYLFFNRNTRWVLPYFVQKSELFENVLENQREKYKKINRDNLMKNRYLFSVGDIVLLKRDKKENKFQSNFYHEPCEITSKKGTMITVKKGGKLVTRNESFFKLCNDQKGDMNNEIEKDNGLKMKTYPLRSKQN